MADASSFEVQEPILSSPFEEPIEHWWIEQGTPAAPSWEASRRLLLPGPRGPSIRR